MFQKWIDEYIAFEKKLTEIIKENKGDVKNVYARIDATFNPKTLTLVNEESVTIFAEINCVYDRKITVISFSLMRRLIDEGYMKYKHGTNTVFLYNFFIENFIDFEEALEE